MKALFVATNVLYIVTLIIWVFCFGAMISTHNPDDQLRAASTFAVSTVMILVFTPLLYIAYGDRYRAS